MTIRTATIVDLDSIVELFDAYRVWYRKPSDKISARAFIKNRLEQKESVVLLAEIENNHVGFTQLYPVFSSVRMKKMWLLNDLYVKESHRGQGISKSLINGAKKLCQKSDSCGILLETEPSNIIGNKLYPSQGFHLEASNFYFWTNNNTNKS